MRRRTLFIGGVAIAALAGGAALVLRQSDDAVAAGGWDPGITEFDKVLGDPEAPVTIVEYASFTCPHCASFHAETMPALKERFIDTGQVRFVFRDFPLDEQALRAGMMARCVPDAQYFNVVDVVFSTLNQWSSGPDWRQSLSRIGRMVGLSQEAFDACMADEQLEADILGLRMEGQNQFRIQATPSFVINGKTLSGGRSIDDFAEIIGDHTPSN